MTPDDLRRTVAAAYSNPTAGRKAIERAWCERSLYAFMKRSWPVLEPGTKFVDGRALEAICEHLEAVTLGQIHRLIINVPPGFSKALDEDTPILTTWGWKRHGDIQPGDFVFGPDGQPKRVLAVTDEVIEDGYEVLFDDRSKIIASASHLWEVEREYVSADTKWKRARQKEVYKTEDLIAKEKTCGTWQRPDRIRITDPVNYAPARLLIDPYLLGAWLGDGATSSGCIYAAEQDIDHFKGLGRISMTKVDPNGKLQTFYRIQIDDLHTHLRVLGLLGNKHVPDQYLESSIDQRLALLQGLMDTDGCCAKNGTCSFTNKNKQIIDSIVTLINSLGMKANLTSRMTVLNGKKYGPHYHVQFTARPGTMVFRLERKQSRVKFAESDRTVCRYVQSIKNVGPRIVKCLSVEGELYLAGKEFIKTHNSRSVSVCWPAWEWGPMGLPHMRYVGVAGDRDLAGRDARLMKTLVTSEWYQEHWPNVQLSSDQKEKTNFENTDRGFRMTATPLNVTGRRGNRLIMDDLLSIKKGFSDAHIAAAELFFREAGQNRLNDIMNDAIVLIMQRVHERDPTGIALEMKHSGYELLCLPMEYEPLRHCKTSIGWEDWRTKEGELAWPERYPAEIIPALKDQGAYAWASQYQQSPEIRGGNIFKREWWQYWVPAITESTGKPEVEFPNCEYIVAAVDTAYTAKKENDPSAMVIMGSFGDHLIVLYAWEERLEFNDLLKRVARSCRQFGVSKLLVENKASGISISQEMKRVFKGRDFGVETFNPGDNDKISRARAVQHMLEHGEVFVRCEPNPDEDGNPVLKPHAVKLIDRAAKFPRDAHDDIVDAFVMCLAHMRKTGMATLQGERDAEERDLLRIEKPAKPLYPGSK